MLDLAEEGFTTPAATASASLNGHFPGTRQNASVRTLPRVHPGNVGLGVLTPAMHSIARACVSALGAIVLQSTPAFPQNGDFRCPQVGTQFKFSTGAELESLGEAGELICRFKNMKDNQNFERLMAIWVPTAHIVKNDLAKFKTLNPLRVGKTFDYSDGQYSWIYRVLVERHEVVKVAAGDIPAFVVLLTSIGVRDKSVFERRYWYSPLLGYVVKMEGKSTWLANPRC